EIRPHQRLAAQVPGRLAGAPGFFRTAVEWPDEVKRDSLDVSRLFPLAGPRRGAFELARAGERPDAAVRELRDGAVQGRVPRQGKAALRAGGKLATLAPRRRQAQRSGERRLYRLRGASVARCSATSPSATTSSRT